MVTRRDSRAARRAWRTVEAVQEVWLCRDCFAAMNWVLGVAVGPAERRPAGYPLTASAEALDSSHCNFCGGGLPEHSFDIQMLPARRTFVRRDVYKFIGQVRQFRCCLFCLAWCRSVLYDGTGAAPEERSIRMLHSGPAASLALLPQDRSAVARFAQESGFDHLAMRAGGAAHYLSTSGGVLFLGTSGDDGATSVLRTLDAEARSRVVLVGRPDAMADFTAALALAPAAFVTSPVPAAQVEGAFEQAAGGRQRNHHRSGLVAVTEARTLGGFEPFKVEPAQEIPLAEAAWLVRRVCGGRDRLYATRSGTLALQARCSPDARERFVHRLNVLLEGAAFAYADAAHEERRQA